jgi:hypothetical protein
METGCLERDMSTMMHVVGALIALALRCRILMNMQGREHEYW